MLAFDSGAQPQIVLTKSDVADDIEATVDELRAVAAGVPVHIASGITRVGLEPIRAAAGGSHTCVLRCLWSWQVDARELADWTPRDGNLRVRKHDQRGRHTTVATQLLPLADGGWLIDTRV